MNEYSENSDITSDDDADKDFNISDYSKGNSSDSETSYSEVSEHDLNEKKSDIQVCIRQKAKSRSISELMKVSKNILILVN